MAREGKAEGLSTEKLERLVIYSAVRLFTVSEFLSRYCPTVNKTDTSR